MISTVDLHCHSTNSDGSLTPEQLIIRAKQKGVKMLALTDHDSINGLVEAQKTADEQAIILITGVELSCTWGKQTIHITGLNIDPENQKLQDLLKKLTQFRAWRGEKIGQKLEKIGIKNAYAETLKLVKGGLLTRTHYGQFLTKNGHAKTMQDAFKKYLLNGKKAYVKGEWASLSQVVDAVHNAGGLVCIAHPKRYQMTNTKLNRLFMEFDELGGDAIEVVNANSSADAINYLKNCVMKYDFKASIGSDFHHPSKYIELGRLKPLPKECAPIWQYF